MTLRVFIMKQAIKLISLTTNERAVGKMESLLKECECVFLLNFQHSIGLSNMSLSYHSHRIVSSYWFNLLVEICQEKMSVSASIFRNWWMLEKFDRFGFFNWWEEYSSCKRLLVIFHVFNWFLKQFWWFRCQIQSNPLFLAQNLLKTLLILF